MSKELKAKELESYFKKIAVIVGPEDGAGFFVVPVGDAFGGFEVGDEGRVTGD